MRGFGAALVPGRPRGPAPPPAAARAGARRRASYQMNAEIPTRITSAPPAIAIALEPLNELLPELGADVVVLTGGAVVVVATVGLGKPESGFVPLDSGVVALPDASAIAGNAATTIVASTTPSV